MGPVQEEGRAVVVLNQVDSPIREVIGEIGSLRHVVRQGFNPPGGKVALCRVSPAASADIHLKPLMLRVILLFAQVPFPHIPGVISGVPQGFGQGVFLQGQMIHIGDFQQLSPIVAAQILGQPHSRRIFAGHQAGAAGRTHGTGGISLGEHRSLGCQCVDVGGFIKGAAKALQVPPPHVINQDHHKIGLFHGNASFHFSLRMPGP